MFTLYGAAFLVVAAVLLLGWAVLARPDAAVAATQANLLRGLPQAAGPVVAAPRRSSATSLVGLLTPGGTTARLQRLVARAGYPAEWPVQKLLAAKLVLLAITVALGFLFLTGSPGVIGWLLVAFFAVLAYFVPELLLHSRGQERQQKIAVELADTLDQMTIAVEAGLGFESAMSQAARNGKGPLAEELVRTLQDIGVGQPRRDAYLALAERTQVEDLGRFVRAVLQADAYGVSIADVLRTQAGEMRLKRRQRAEEKAMKIPVKVIFPLILFILPALFIVVMGPAVIDIMGAFSR
ncbi:type II secretion system F family protein [Blastococcus saxobsidens]|uniref:Flp pilus assembly protein TadC n=1 Tax=Blastococcus saxobsidens (strain DD2) TaxID=1146883 RepID=H6RRU4_BLASD|nr:type II secretion system F family protein [Blastococcus saxobsidens]CCG02938.1 Flp pilus assembly protein TadC [Blastococcus saxobsidens DD2]